MRLRLGINTCFAVKRWPRPDDWAPIVADRLGLGLVQHSLDLVDLAGAEADLERQATAVRTAAAANRLEVASTFTGLAAYSSNLLLDPDPERRAGAEVWFGQAVRFTALVGAAATGGHVGALSVADAADAAISTARWAELRDRLERIATVARAAGVSTIVVENLAAAREPSTMALVRSLLRPGSPTMAAVALCLDVGHMCVPGTAGDERDPYAWLRQLGAAAPMIQLQQSDAAGDHHWPFTAERNATGRIEADRVLDALADAGVEATDLLLEVIPPFEQEDEAVLDDLSASVDYWRDALRRRGHVGD